MKKKIYLITIWTITLFVIIFSGYHYTKRFKNEYKDFKSEIKSVFSDFDDYDDEEYDWDEDSSSNSSKGLKNIDTALDAFSKIKIEGNIMELTIKEGSDYHLECAYNKEKLKPVFEVSNGLLTIRQNLRGNLHGNSRCRLTLTIPAETQLSSADIEVNVGEMNLKNFTCDTLEAKTNVGSLTIKDINFNKLEAETNVGELIIQTMDDISEYNLDLKTDVGELKVGDRHFKHSYETSGSSNKEIKATTNVGALTVD
ncbi:MAG: DUF4097 domain-containing protein [Treponema sp.]|nr:DUF4097 domain-containing protein [Treponema sp.]